MQWVLRVFWEKYERGMIKLIESYDRLMRNEWESYDRVMRELGVYY